MKNFNEMNAEVLMDCIAKLSDPAERIFMDGAVIDALDSYRKQMTPAEGEKVNVDKAFSLFVKMVMPVLMGAHKADTYDIMGVMRDQTADEVKQSNGGEVMRDIFVVFALQRDVEGLFRPGCEVRG